MRQRDVDADGPAQCEQGIVGLPEVTEHCLLHTSRNIVRRATLSCGSSARSGFRGTTGIWSRPGFEHSLQLRPN